MIYDRENTVSTITTDQEQAAEAAADAAAWETFDPVGVLAKLVAVGV